ncbi:MAG TPA: Hsp70 family protein, partial [Pseudonocardiaceae bacterium]
MMLRVAVDFGTSSTCAAVSVDGRTPEVVVVDGAPLMPSAVYVTGDGTLFVGHEADRQAAVDPSRYEPNPKRRIDEPELLLGDTVLPVVGVVRAVLRRALQEARHLAGGAPVDQLVLTHPANWGGTRTEKLRRSAAGLAAEVVLVPEPVAAAVFHSGGRSVPEGGCLAVLDLGGGTVDASVVRRVGPGFRVLATRGDPNFGGADVDQALLEHVGAQVADTDPEAWRRLVEGRELADRRRRRVLNQDIRGAKETLSRHTYADVPMPPPFPDAHVTRADLEALIAAPMGRTVTLLADTLAAAGLRAEQLVGVFLVGGSSRIPMVSRLLHERLGVVPVTLDQPETVVARGGLRAVMADPDRATVPGGPGHALPTPVVTG